MAGFEVVRYTELPAREAWDRLTDWERHGELIPLTAVALTGIIRNDVGATFVARTSLGPLHFDDPMQVTTWQPPVDGESGTCRVTKKGRVVVGWAELTVTPDRDAMVGGATVCWREDAGLRAPGNLLSWPNRVVGRWTFGKLVDGLLDDSVPQ